MEEGEDPIGLGMPYHIPYIVAWLVGFLVLAFVVFGKEKCAKGWQHGKGLVPPFTIIGVVLGSIYGGITGITEAAGMGALAVFLISVFMAALLERSCIAKSMYDALDYWLSSVRGGIAVATSEAARSNQATRLRRR